MLTYQTLFLILLVLINLSISSCWNSPCPFLSPNVYVHRIRNTCTSLTSLHLSSLNEEENNLYSEQSYKEGEELARELYELVKIREFKEKLQENETQMMQLQPDDTDSFSVNKDNTLSAGLFTQSKSAYFSSSSDRLSEYNSNNVKRQMMEQEFNLVNMATNERTILIQAALCLILLVFYLYVGFMGGITSGSFTMEDMMADFDYDQVNEQVVEKNVPSLWI